ncbi:MAG: LL-diaminopimelate aminotransferase [Propionibacteriaceae bacterium]|jgi:LL-diaminopimelate aminotransferase|nr:LL-diaminopimelate aminotransferase [Propionibacteriaceae bacterium]
MATINPNFAKLPGNYLFADIARQVEEYAAAHPGDELIRLGIGDVTRPIAPAVTAAMHAAVDEMAQAASFHGYGPYEGYEFLRRAIQRYDYAARGVEIGLDEIFVSDGAKSDTANLGELFGSDNVVAVCDPVYPVYVDSNALAGRLGEYAGGTWERLVYVPCTADNGFVAEPPREHADMVYLCFPNNPTGVAATREQLAGWVAYARAHDAVIVYDSAYEAYISSGAPHSIFEIDGAAECAIECRSFSKTAGFTGTRLGYTVIPKALKRGGTSLNELWRRRAATKSNGVAYVVQRGGAAVYTPEGCEQTQATIAYYMNNARVIREGLQAAGLAVYGGVDAPYLWVAVPGAAPSWEFFRTLLHEAKVVTTPGVGFGPGGEGYIRLTAFGTAEATAEAVERIRAIL